MKQQLWTIEVKKAAQGSVVTMAPLPSRTDCHRVDGLEEVFTVQGCGGLCTRVDLAGFLIFLALGHTDLIYFPYNLPDFFSNLPIG